MLDLSQLLSCTGFEGPALAVEPGYLDLRVSPEASVVLGALVQRPQRLGVQVVEPLPGHCALRAQGCKTVSLAWPCHLRAATGEQRLEAASRPVALVRQAAALQSVSALLAAASRAVQCSQVDASADQQAVSEVRTGGLPRDRLD